MASDILAVLLKANLAASAAILLVFVLRRPVRQWFGARVAYALWLSVPLAAFASLLPARTVVIPYAPATDPVIQEIAGPASLATGPALAVDVSAALIALWLAGAAISLAALVWSQARYMKRLGCVQREGGYLRAMAQGAGPAVVGVFNPRIVLPADFETRYDAAEQRVVLAHEAAHLACGDALINAVTATARCVLWFNPLIYFADRYVRIDQEFACDAAVLAAYPDERRLYGEALLKSQIAPAPLPLGCYWPAGASTTLKERIRMLRFETPSRARKLFGTAGVLAVCVAAGLVAWGAQPATVAMAAAPTSLKNAVVPASLTPADATPAQGAYHTIETYPIRIEPYSLTVTMPDGKVQTLTSPRPIPPIIGSEATPAYRAAQRMLAAAEREATARAARGAPPQPLTPRIEATFKVLRQFEQTVRAKRAAAPESRYDRITVTFPAGSTLGGATLTRERRFGLFVRSPFTAESKARSLASVDKEMNGASAQRRGGLIALRAILVQRPTTSASAERLEDDGR